ncbi:MAG: CPBP family intramembrane glutamic endopeptidase [Pseudomonadota bacterium]
MTNISPLPPARGVPLSFGDLLLIAILGLGTARILSILAAPYLVTPGAGRAMVVVVLLALHSAALLSALYLIAVRWRGLEWHDLGLVPTTGQWVRRAIPIAILAHPATVLLKLGTQKLLEIPDENPQLDLIAPSGITTGEMVAMIIMVAFVVPFTEELVFRGLLYRWLRNRWGVFASALISGVCFAALHNIVLLIPALTLLGMILAWLTERSGSIWPAIVTHGLFNAITVFLLYSTKLAGVDFA